MGFGPVYPTTSKDDAGPVSGLKGFREVVKSVLLPIIAIGGVGEENIPDLIQAGAGGIAVISAVCCQENPEEATRSLYRALQG